MSAMISSLKENRRLAHRKNDLKDKKKGKRAGLIGNPIRIGKRMSAEERKAFREGLSKAKLKSNRVIGIVFGGILALTFLFIYWVESL